MNLKAMLSKMISMMLWELKGLKKKQKNINTFGELWETIKIILVVYAEQNKMFY